ncbi:MAG: cytochrome c biogenesis protein CcsA [Bacteroidales bacterium]|nr:cytochrome c biogenesis protein CcsA [Bacteroidales bacterium]
MKKYINFLFSMRFTAILFVVFGLSIATATFIENDFGTDSARAVIYNTKWFELVLFLGMINLIVNIFRAKLYKKEKLPMFIFHIAFVVIILGAGITRYIGFEGSIGIREGASSNTVVSDKAYIQIEAKQGENVYKQEDYVLFSPLRNSRYSSRLGSGDKKIEVKLAEFIPNASETLAPAGDGEQGFTMQEMVISGDNGRETVIMKEGDERRFKSIWISFSGSQHQDGVRITNNGGRAMISASFDFTVMSMADQSTVTFKADSIYPFLPMHLYNFNGVMVVPQSFMENAIIRPMKNPGAEKNMFMDALVFNVSSQGQSKQLTVWGKKGVIGEAASTEIAGSRVDISYGSMAVSIPFSLRLEDFFLERYPGSNSPSWFESKVTLFDPVKKISEPHRIFMNNVLIYQGYRFYQSSYDNDEHGTILSVNKDFWGTWVSYIGYLLMGLGMAMTLFNPNSRFTLLSRKIKEVRESRKLLTALLFGLFMMAAPANAQMSSLPHFIDPAHAKSFGELLVQDHGGRIEPINTMSSDIVRKVARKTEINGLNPDQVILGMLQDPGYWQTVRMIRVSNDQLARELNLDSKYAAFQDFLNNEGYVLQSAVEQAYRKKPAYRSKYDNELMKVDERVNICYMIYSQGLLKVLPKKDDVTGKWYTPVEAGQAFTSDDTVFTRTIFPVYLQSLDQAVHSGDYTQANEYLTYLKSYQQKYGASLLPSENTRKLELYYNKLGIFGRLSGIYGLIGFVLLMLHFVQIFMTRLKLDKIITVASWLVILTFIAHTAGLAMRWYISGHAPWSNGYEALVYISWATILAGLIFSRKSKITLAATAILAYLILFVAHLSWMDPEITNLVPVLKSYWLVIHVAIITASYGFLALGAVMAAINLFLMILKSEKSMKRVDLVIQELSYIIEMTLIVGLFMVSIGTFLGGVWANESWGRYWGWDAKETWALVTVIVYSFIAHMRMVPGLKDIYKFNLAALVGFSSVIMTYFGVNYYLSGLHSYAAGDPLPVPRFVYYTIVIVTVVALAAYFNQRKLEKLEQKPE